MRIVNFVIGLWIVLSLAFLAGAILSCVVSCSTTPKVQPLFNDHDYLDNMPIKEDAIIRLHDSKGVFFCSGVVISKIYALTAAHCLAKNEEVQVHTSQNKDIGTKAKRASLNHRNDVGILEGDFSGYNVAPLQFRAGLVLHTILNTNNTFVSCGFPYGAPLFCVEFAGPKQLGFQFGGISYLYPGMSGGPVFDLDTKELIGVNSAVGEGFAVFSPLIEVFASLGIPVVGENQ